MQGFEQVNAPIFSEPQFVWNFLKLFGLLARSRPHRARRNPSVFRPDQQIRAGRGLDTNGTVRAALATLAATCDVFYTQCSVELVYFCLIISRFEVAVVASSSSHPSPASTSVFLHVDEIIMQSHFPAAQLRCGAELCACMIPSKQTRCHGPSHGPLSHGTPQ